MNHYEHGNTSTQTQCIIIDDVSAPVAHLTALADVTGECSVKAPSAPTATDNCSGFVTITNNAELPIVARGTTVVTWTFNDANGNSSTQTQEVVINDETIPDFTAMSDTVIDLEQGQSIYIVSSGEFDLRDVYDNCSVDAISNDFNQQETLEGAELKIGITNITWTVSDKSGNLATSTFSVTVNAFVAVNDIKALGIKVYPNPTSGELKIISTKENVESITISNINGGVILLKTNPAPNAILDLSNWESGIYVVKIQTTQGTSINRIMKN